jgi:transposase InsO family protein
LRQNYHFGPFKIAMYLKRYHDISVSQSGVWRILRRLDLSRLPTSQRYKRHKERWKRYEKQRPGLSVQIDVQFTAIDDCTRLRVLKIYGQLNQKTAIQFADYVLEKLPFRVEQIQTDNGAEFQSAFHWHLLDRGLRHVHIRPLTPRLNGKVERSHRIDDEEFYRMLAGQVIDDAKILNIKLQEWEHFYNSSDLTVRSRGRRPTSGYARRLGPPCKRSLSVQHRSQFAVFGCQATKAGSQSRLFAG